MTDLTEQFNNDKLDDSKLYYFKQKMSEEIEVGRPFALNMVRAMDDTYLDWFLIDKVLAPVPSYNEWIGVKQQRDLENKLRHDSDNRNWQLRTENAKLKKQLEIAIKCLRNYKSGTTDKWFAEVALEQIEELEK